MKADVKKLINFLNKVLIKGDAISDAKLSFREDGLYVNAKDLTKTGAIQGKLGLSSFMEYTPMEVAIHDTRRLLSILSNMSGVVDIKIEKNALLLNSSGVRAELIMPQKEYLQCSLSDEETEKLFGLKEKYDAGFDIDSELLAKSRKGSQTLSTSSVVASVKNNMFSLQSGEENFDKLAFEINVEYKDVSAKYGSTLLEFTNVISGQVNITFNDNYPMFITSFDQDSTVTWMLAPIIPEDE